MKQADHFSANGNGNVDPRATGNYFFNRREWPGCLPVFLAELAVTAGDADREGRTVLVKTGDFDNNEHRDNCRNDFEHTPTVSIIGLIVMAIQKEWSTMSRLFFGELSPSQAMPASTRPVPSQGCRFRFGNKLAQLLLGVVLLSGGTLVAADEDPADMPATPPQEDLRQEMVDRLRRLQQPGDDELETLKDETPDEAAENSRKALAYYMAGRSYEREKKFNDAYEAYKQALQLDESSLSVYRALIPLAFRLDKTEEAIRLAQKAVQLDPNNFELLSQLGIYALRQQDLQGSIDYFQKAVDSQTVDKLGGPYISIMSQLGQLYLSIGDNEKAAKAYESVYKALANPSDYQIDFRTRQALENLRGSKAETFESFGELFLATDRLDLAEGAFQQARKATRKNSEVYGYQLARVLNKRGEHAQAVEALQEYFDAGLSSKGRGPYLLLAELLNEQDKGDEITSTLEKLAEADPKNEQLQVYLAERYIKDDRLADAEAIYDKYAGEGSNNGDLQLGLLQIYRQRNEPEKALKALTKALLHGANNERVEAELELLAQNEELADRLIELGQAKDLEGDPRELFSEAYLLAKLGMQRKKYEAVVDFYQRAMEVRQDMRGGNNSQVVLTLYNELIQFLRSEEQYELTIEALEYAIDDPSLAPARQVFELQLVQTLVEAELYDRALEVVKSAQEVSPDSLTWEYQEGWVYYSKQEWEQAVRILGPLLEKAITQNNSSVEREVRYNLSRALAFAGLADEALELMQQSIEKEPNQLLWQFQKGWLYYFKHDWKPAIEAFKALIENSGDSDNQLLVRQARFSLSAAYVQDGQLDEGERILEEVYEKDPDDVSVCNDLGYLYADRGKKLDQALEMIQKAIDAEPENRAYLDSMGWVLFRLGRYEESLKYLEKAVEDSEEGDGVLWDHLGDCYDKLGRSEKAQQAWKTALEHEQEAQYSDEKLVEKLKQKLESKE